jgi:membrane protein required for colicin V production
MPTLTGWDWFVLLTAGLSVLSGAVTGLSRTLAGLTAWLIALAGTPMLAPVAVRNLGLQTYEVLIWLGVFIALLALARFAAFVMTRSRRGLGPGGADRLAGAVWGFIRALVLVIAAVGAAQMIGLTDQPSWRHALTRPALDFVLHGVQPHLPLLRGGDFRN